MSAVDRWSVARAEREWLARHEWNRRPGGSDEPCSECNGSGEGKWGGWCHTCGGDGTGPHGGRS